MTIDELMVKLEELKNKVGGDAHVTVKDENSSLYYVIDGITEVDAEQSYCWGEEKFYNDVFEKQGTLDKHFRPQPLKIKIIELKFN